jgi:chromosome segregation ATPase
LANANRIRAAEKKQEIESAAALDDRVEQRAKTQRSIDQLADSAFAKASEVWEKSRKVEVVIAGYRAGRDRTGRMQSAKRGIDAESNEGSYRISQIDFQIDSISNDIENAHDQVRSYMQGLSEFMADATSKSSQFLAECQADRLLNCSRLSGSMQSLQARYQQFRRDYGRENAAFNGRGGSNT